jgi:predicted amidohydrolase YtcJ
VYAALETFTVNAAWAIKRDDRLGRITPRFLADFTLLADNPLTVDTGAIAAIPVVGTVVDGQTWLA